MIKKEKKTLVLHVGYPKAGSTTLQENLFSNIEDITYLGKRIKFDNCYPFKHIHELLPKPPFLYYMENEDINKLRSIVEKSPMSTVVISAEALCHRKGVMSTLENRKKYPGRRNDDVDPKLTAQHLRRIFSECMADIVNPRIIIFIRRQGDILPSFYAQSATYHIYRGLYKKGFENFITYFFNANEGFLKEYLFYDLLVDEFVKNFGWENVQIIPMEAFFDQKENDIKKRLLKFMNLDLKEKYINMNKQYNQRSISSENVTGYKVNNKHGQMRTGPNRIRLLKAIYKFIKFTRIDYRLGPVINNYLNERDLYGDFQVTKERKDELTAAFTNSNRRLAERYELESQLHHYSYLL